MSTPAFPLDPNRIPIIAPFQVPTADYAAIAYDGSGNIATVTYKVSGSTGTTVATLTLAYDGSNNLTSITKS